MNKNIRKYLSEIGRKGGKKSRRILSTRDSKNMLLVREARRSFRNCYSQCFWSFDPNYKVTFKDIPWVIDQLLKNGNQYTMKYVRNLCH